eukprot:5844383-Amphidinium_carterae.2
MLAASPKPSARCHPRCGKRGPATIDHLIQPLPLYSGPHASLRAIPPFKLHTPSINLASPLSKGFANTLRLLSLTPCPCMTALQQGGANRATSSTSRTLDKHRYKLSQFTATENQTNCIVWPRTGTRIHGHLLRLQCKLPAPH